MSRERRQNSKLSMPHGRNYADVDFKLYYTYVTLYVPWVEDIMDDLTTTCTETMPLPSVVLETTFVLLSVRRLISTLIGKSVQVFPGVKTINNAGHCVVDSITSRHKFSFCQRATHSQVQHNR